MASHSANASNRASRAAAAAVAIAAALLAVSCSATFTGKVSVKGSEPHTYLALETQDHRELEIVGPLAAKIRALYQGRTLTVEGSVTEKGAGPGFPPKLKVERILNISGAGTS